MAQQTVTPHWQSAGCSTVSAMIFVDAAEAVVSFAEKTFGAKPVSRPLRHADGSLWHAALKIGDSTVMVARRPEGMPATTAFLHVYVEDAEASYRHALDNGATATMAPETQFYGDRAGGVTDVAGNIWWIATHVEDVDDDELDRRARAHEASGAAG